MSHGLDSLNATADAYAREQAEEAAAAEKDDRARRARFVAIEELSRHAGFAIFLREMDLITNQALQHAMAANDPHTAARALGELRVGMVIRKWLDANLAVLEPTNKPAP